MTALTEEEQEAKLESGECCESLDAMRDCWVSMGKHGDDDDVPVLGQKLIGLASL